MSAQHNHSTHHRLQYSTMQFVVRVKKSLKKPIRKLTGCVLGAKEKSLCASHRTARSRGVCHRRRKSPLRQTAHSRDSGPVRSYQADLEKERKLRESMNAQKNAERAAMRAHFRRKYQLSEDPQDSHHLRSVGGKVKLPHELSKIIYPETKTKDDGFNLLSAFQGLSFGPGVFTERSRTSIPHTTTTDFCKVM